MSKLISRRELLKRAGVAGVAAVVPVTADKRPQQGPAFAAPQAAAAREPLEQLTAMESDVLEAIVARLIPSDARGPGAKEARAAHYIDRALGGALASSRQTYESGLASLDRYSRSARGKPFTELAATDQDAVLRDVETGAATGFAESSAQFFNLV